MRSGNLDRQITIERKTTTRDPNYGSEIVTWVPLAVLPGSPEVAERFAAEVMDVPPSRSESVRQGLAMARNQTRVRLRYRNDIDSAMRVIVHGDTDVTYQIVGGPAMLGRKELIELVLERYSS